MFQWEEHAQIITEVSVVASSNLLCCRYYGRKILYILLDHPEFDKLLSKFATTNLQKLREIVENLKTKVKMLFQCLVWAGFCMTLVGRTQPCIFV